MPGERGGWGARAGIATAAILLATSLAGTPLYVSASGSEAIQQQLALTCGFDSGLVLGLPLISDRQVSLGEIDALVADVPHLDAPILNMVTNTVADTALGKRRINLLVRQGGEQQVTPHVTPLALNEIAVPDIAFTRLGLQVGDHMTATDINGAPVDILIGQRFDSLPFLPEPSFWCGYKELLRPTSQGDPPPAWGLVTPETMLSFGGRFGTFLEYRVQDRPFTLKEATDLNRDYERVAKEYSLTFGSQNVANPSELPVLLQRANSLASAVDKSIAGVRLAGIVAAIVVLLASAVMLAQERRRELRLLALRGVAPWRSATRLLPVVGIPIVVGSLVGFWMAFAGVRLFGPTPEVERAAVIRAVISVAVATVIAVVIVAGATAIVGDRFVDAGARRRRMTFVPFELIVVALAFWSYRHLDDVGGLRMFGTQARGGDLLAQAFPLFGVIAVVAVAARVVRWLARWLRLTGRRLPQSIRLGWRRAVVQPGLTAAMVGAVALACGCYTVSTMLSASSQQQLEDKAQTFVGADASLTVFEHLDLPPSLAGTATQVVRIEGRAKIDGALSNEPFEILGVDRATFARVVRMRADAAGKSLDDLLASIAPTELGDPLPAILVSTASPGETFEFTTVQGRPVAVIRPVSTATWFPGFQNGRSFAIVDADALVNAPREIAISFRRQVWLRDPPADAVTQITDTGARVGAITRASGVFDVASYSAQRWSYEPLTALGALFAVVVVTMQLLVLEARRDSRRMSHVVLSRMGFRTRALWLSAVVEVGLPLVLGAIIGVAAGRFSSGAAMRHLDTLPKLKPPTRLVAPIGSFIGLAVVLAITVVVLAAMAVRSTLRGRTMEVMRGTA